MEESSSAIRLLGSSFSRATFGAERTGCEFDCEAGVGVE